MKLETLRGMPLELVSCDFVPERDTKVLKSLTTLNELNGRPVEEFWKRVASGDIPK